MNNLKLMTSPVTIICSALLALSTPNVDSALSPIPWARNLGFSTALGTFLFSSAASYKPC